jgi:hypothetical protein
LIFNFFPMFYKLLAADLCHNDVTYQEGLNVDPVPFDPSGDCKPGGLYYTDFEHIPRWCFARWPLIADVSVPDDARVYAEPCGTKWKADRIELSNIRPLSEFLKTLDETTLCGMLAKEGKMLEYVCNQTETTCLVAVVQNGWALQFVRNQTEAICLAAVQNAGGALQFVRDQNNVICLAAVQQDGHALYHVRKQTEAICLAAVRQNGYALSHVTNQNDALCLAAVQQDWRALFLVRNQTEELCRATVQKYPDAKLFVKIPIDF